MGVARKRRQQGGRELRDDSRQTSATAVARAEETGSDKSFPKVTEEGSLPWDATGRWYYTGGHGGLTVQEGSGSYEKAGGHPAVQAGRAGGARGPGMH